jgi:hypothetical protein
MAAEAITEVPLGTDVEVAADGGSDDRKQKGVHPAKRSQHFRQNTFDRFLVEAALLMMTLTAIITIAVCVMFVLCRGTTPRSVKPPVDPDSIGGAGEGNETVALMFRILPPLNRRVMRAIVPLCTAHVVALPLAFSGFFCLGLLYLLSGGCPGTSCVRFRNPAVVIIRIVFAVGLAVASFSVTWIMVIGDLCALSYRSCIDDEMDRRPAPAGSLPGFASSFL